jgi:hypothetical protein
VVRQLFDPGAAEQRTTGTRFGEQPLLIFIDILKLDAHGAFPTRPRKAAAFQKNLLSRHHLGVRRTLTV